MTNHQDSQAGDELEQKIITQVQAYTIMKGGNIHAETLGAYIAIDNIMKFVNDYAERLATRRAVEELKHLESLPSHVIRGSLINRIATLTKEIQQ